MSNGIRCLAPWWVAAVGSVVASAASAEIVLMEHGGAASMEPEYAFTHPSLRSIVFASPQARQMAILPAAPIFVQPPPLLWRAPTPFPPYPPASAPLAPNSSTRPSNRDVTTYHLQRAHGFSQELFYRNNFLMLGTSGGFPLWNNGVMPAYPPAAPGSNRPSNRDNATYNLERAHRFSTDNYKKP